MGGTYNALWTIDRRVYSTREVVAYGGNFPSNNRCPQGSPNTWIRGEMKDKFSVDDWIDGFEMKSDYQLKPEKESNGKCFFTDDSDFLRYCKGKKQASQGTGEHKYK